MRIAAVCLAIVVLAAMSGCASTGDAAGQEAAQGSDAAPATDTEKGTKIVRSGGGASDPGAVTCKEVQRTGTRFKSKVCATNRQWQATEEYSQDATERMQSRPQFRDDGD